MLPTASPALRGRPGPSLGLLVTTLALLAACSGGPTAPTVASVQVTPGSVTLRSVGATEQLSARGLDAQGQPISGETVSWSTDAPDVASVSPAGLVTALTGGVARIEATVAGVSGAATVTVVPAAQECVDPVPVNLPAGGHRVFGAQECFLLPSGNVGDRYRVVVLRPDSGAASDVVESTLSVTGLGTATGPSSPSLRTGDRIRTQGLRLSPSVQETLLRSAELARSTAAHHNRLRAEEGRLIRDLGPELRLVTSDAAPRAAPALAPGPSPQTVRVNPATTCAGGSLVTGMLIYEDENLAFYQDSAQNVIAPILPSQAQRMADYYAAFGKSLVEDYFGVPTDIDDNERMVVFATPEVANDEVAAYVWSGDFVPEASCAASNEGEYIFFNGGLIRAMDDPVSRNFQAMETLVHEVKHVVSLYQRLQASIQAGNQSRFQPLWVEEGAAEVAGNLSSRLAIASLGGPPLNARMGPGDLVPGETSLQATPENYGVLIRMIRTIWYLWSQPNGVVVSPSGAHPLSSIYGSGWHFHRWLGDAYGAAASGPGADASLFRQLTDSATGPGTQGLLQVTGKGYQTLLEEYALAVALQGTGVPQPTRGFSSYDFLEITDILCDAGDGPCRNPQPDGLYPWPVTERAQERGVTVPADFSTADYAGPIGPTGIRIHDFQSNGSGTGARIEVQMDAPGRVVVVRIQ